MCRRFPSARPAGSATFASDAPLPQRFPEAAPCPGSLPRHGLRVGGRAPALKGRLLQVPAESVGWGSAAGFCLPASACFARSANR